MEKSDEVMDNGPTVTPLRTQCGYIDGAVLNFQQFHVGESGRSTIKYGGKYHTEGIVQLSLSQFYVMAILVAHGPTSPPLRTK